MHELASNLQRGLQAGCSASAGTPRQARKASVLAARSCSSHRSHRGNRRSIAASPLGARPQNQQLTGGCRLSAAADQSHRRLLLAMGSGAKTPGRLRAGGQEEGGAGPAAAAAKTEATVGARGCSWASCWPARCCVSVV